MYAPRFQSFVKSTFVKEIVIDVYAYDDVLVTVVGTESSSWYLQDSLEYIESQTHFVNYITHVSYRALYWT